MANVDIHCETGTSVGLVAKKQLTRTLKDSRKFLLQ